MHHLVPPIAATMKLLAILTALTLSLASATPSHTSYILHRRLVDPSSPTAPFVTYGTVETDIDVASYALALQLGTGGIVPPRARFVKAEEIAKGAEMVDLERAWVQVAVQVDGRDEEEWPRSAVRAVSTLSTFWIVASASCHDSERIVVKWGTTGGTLNGRASETLACG
jgi:hypothetical protein